MSDEKVVQLRPGKTIPCPPADIAADADPVLVRMLEDLLQQARTGDLQWLCFVGHDNGTAITSGWSAKARTNVHLAIGAVSALQYQMQHAFIEVHGAENAVL